MLQANVLQKNVWKLHDHERLMRSVVALAIALVPVAPVIVLEDPRKEHLCVPRAPKRNDLPSMPHFFADAEQRLRVLALYDETLVCIMMACRRWRYPTTAAHSHSAVRELRQTHTLHMCAIFKQIQIHFAEIVVTAPRERL